MNKLQSLLLSRRFWAAVAGVAVIVGSEVFHVELDAADIVGVVAIVVGWITGDTIRETK